MPLTVAQYQMRRVVYQYFKTLGFPKVLLVFLLAQIVGTALALLLVELLPALARMPDAGFEILRAGPNLLLVAWYLFDMRRQGVDIAADFRTMLDRISLMDLVAIVSFNFLAGLFSVLGLISAAVALLPQDTLSDMSQANGLGTTTTLVGVLMASFVAVFLAPPAEEFIFRGALPSILQRKLSLWPSFVISSILFAAIHFSLSAVTTFIFAMMLCIVVHKTRNLAVVIVLHMANNLIVSVVQIVGYFSQGERSADLTDVGGQFFAIGLPSLAGATLIALYLARRRHFFDLGAPFETAHRPSRTA